MTEKQGTPLAGLTGFTAEILAKLAAYWIVNCEDLVGAAVGEGDIGVADGRCCERQQRQGCKLFAADDNHGVPAWLRYL